MDLGIKGRRAIVCASSKGLGRACAMALANEGVHVTVTARGADALKKTADEIRKAHPGVTVTDVVQQPWKMRDFTLRDPSGVCWRIAQNT